MYVLKKLEGKAKFVVEVIKEEDAYSMTK